MRRHENAPAHRAADVTPSIRPAVPWRVAAVRALPGRRLSVTFVDGTQGTVDLNHLLADPKVDDTPFAPLRDQTIFDRVTLEHGAVTWPTGSDLAPDAMYDAIRERGCWVVGT